MDSFSAITRFLAQVPHFSAMTAEQLQRIGGRTALKVMAKGGAATLAGSGVDDLCIVLSGRLAEYGKGAAAQEFGQGAALETEAFFSRRPASTTLIAMRETLLLTLSRADLAAAFRSHPDLLETCFAVFGDAPPPPTSRPVRLVLAVAGGKGRLDAAIKDAFLRAIETFTDVRILRRESFGSLALDAPDTAHWLQEQDLEFEVTLVVADGADAAFSKEAVEEGDEIVFLAFGGSSALSAVELHALERRGKDRCRLVIAKDKGISQKTAADFVAARSYRSTQFVYLASPKEASLMASAILGRGIAVAAIGSGVYAAAILGGLQALEASGLPPSSLAAAGSAILPAGLLACGASLADTEAVFRALAEPQPWKRAARADTGLYETAAIDTLLARALPEYEIGLAARPFNAISLSLSDRAPKLHCRGRLMSAVRAGLTAPGVLPPFISDENDILVSGEGEIDAVVEAASTLSPSPVFLLYAAPPPLGASATSYRQFAGPTFRITPFQTPSAPEKRLRLETVLGAVASRQPAALPRAAAQTFAIPAPAEIGPLDWLEWDRLRNAAFEWTCAEIVARGLAQP